MKIIATALFVIPFTFCVNAQTKKPVPSSKAAASNTILASINRGKAVYTQSCITCHQTDGAGVQGVNPPLIKTEFVLGDKARLINILLKGLNKELEIDGETYTNAMPPVTQLNDQQVADVLTFVRNSFSNKAGAVTVAQVKAARAQK